jgi:tungstate transport system permease protein
LDYIFSGFRQAVHLIINLDPEVLRIAGVSLKVSTASTILAAAAGIPIAFFIVFRTFRGKGAITTLLNTLLALPTVVVGLLGYSFLSRKGPLGSLDILFTPTAMILGQFILALPIVCALCVAGLKNIDRRVKETALALGASEKQAAFAILSEGRLAVTAAVIAAFGRVFSEVGVSMMLGGNIRFYTRNITTAIALETGRGEFPLAMALGMILIAVALGINILFQITRAVRSV